MSPGALQQGLYVCKYLLAQMTTKAREHGGPSETRDRIIGAALEVFAEKGFSGSTTKEIARRAKVNEVTIFRQFRSKRALFGAVVAERSPMIPIMERVSLDPRGSMDERLLGNVRIVLKMLRSNRHLFYIMMGDAWRQPKIRSLAYNESIKKGLEFVAAMMQGLMDAGKMRRMDPMIPARALMGAVQFYFLTTEILGEGSPEPQEEEKVVRGFVSIFLDGMRQDREG